MTPSDFNFTQDTIRINKSLQRLKGKNVITELKTMKSIRTVKMPHFLAEEMQDYIHRLYGIKRDTRIFNISNRDCIMKWIEVVKKQGLNVFVFMI